MTDEISFQDQAEVLKDMFQSAGWEIFMADMTAQLEAIDNADGIKGEQALGHRQGQVQILRGVVNYEKIVDQVLAQNEQDSSDEETV